MLIKFDISASKMWCFIVAANRCDWNDADAEINRVDYESCVVCVRLSIIQY